VTRWQTKPLGEFAESVDYGVTASATEQPIGPKFLRITDIQDGAVNWELVPWCACDTRSASDARLRAGDIVFARTGATTGKSFLIRKCPTDAVFASYLIRVRVGDSAEPRFVSHFFQTPQYWAQIEKGARGVAQPGVNATTLKALQIPLPPLAEQRRIAEVLDQAEALRAKRRAALAQIDTLTQSLFLDLFGDPATNPKGWPVRQLGELIVDGPQNGLYKPSTDYGSGTPILRIDAFYDGFVTDISTLKRVRLTKAEATSFQLTENDVVINRVNSLEYLGKCALIPELPEPTVFESNMMRMRFDSEIAHPRFVVQFLQTGFAKSQIQMRAKHAVNQASINQQDVSSFRLSLPSVELQQEFARRVTAVEKLKTAHRASLAELDALFATLQHRAFREEL
jgi:type I restriction enzyme S subunit